MPSLINTCDMCVFISIDVLIIFVRFKTLSIFRSLTSILAL